MGAVRHHGRPGGGGRSAGQTALQARPLALQPAPLSQPSGENSSRAFSSLRVNAMTHAARKSKSAATLCVALMENRGC